MDRQTIAKYASYGVILVAGVSLIGSAPLQVIAVAVALGVLKFYVRA